MNVYYHYHDDSIDSAHSNSAESSQKNSKRFNEFRQFMKGRKNIEKVNFFVCLLKHGKKESKCLLSCQASPCDQLTCSLLSESISGRKISLERKVFEIKERDEERDKTLSRRFSVPEKVFN